MALPAEIYNLIFDECISDKSRMAAWGLVHKDYLVSSRFHLFSSVRLDYANAHEFADILDAPSCDITPLIQDLVLSNRSAEPSWFPHVLPRLPAFPNVTTLCLRNSKSVLTEDMRTLLHATLPALTTLEIVNFPFAYRAAAIEFACGFPTLEALTFFPKVTSTLAPATRAQIPHTLRTLALRCAIDEQPNWFLADLAHPSLPALTTLRVREAGARDFPVLVRALARLGDSLESFALDFSDTVVEELLPRDEHGAEAPRADAREHRDGRPLHRVPVAPRLARPGGAGARHLGRPRALRGAPVGGARQDHYASGGGRSGEARGAQGRRAVCVGATGAEHPCANADVRCVGGAARARGRRGRVLVDSRSSWRVFRLHVRAILHPVRGNLFLEFTA
ncbi:hypothetical protein B0H10DRAFT_12023 [Mycena sp. CBHHK59/15]|nr:hypothetical protein B0H10DRAFT_12023 [Mycena sp. CBHHK59/15]